MPRIAVRARLGLALLMALVGLTPALQAEESPSPSLTRGTYEQLSAIRKQMDAGERASAIDKLRALAGELADLPYDQAVAYRTLGYAHAETGDYTAAAKAFGEALALDALPEEEQTRLLLAHGQMLMANEDFTAAVEALERYRRAAADPKDTGLLLLGNAYLQLERYAQARDTLQQLIQRAEEPKEDWYRLLFAAHYELGEFRAGLSVMKTLVAMAPDNKGYWQNLGSLYSRLEQMDKALATRALMYRKGMLKSEDELLDLARMYISRSQPLRAGELLEKEIAAGRIADTVDNQRLLARAWIQARENEKAIEVLRTIAPRAETGELHLQLAQRYYHRQDWARVAENVKAALDKGGLEEPGQALILMGVAHYRAGERQAAARAFTRAQSHAGARDRAQQWLNHIAAKS